MKVDSEKLREAVRGKGQGKVAERLGVTKATMSHKMKRPEMLRVHELCSICTFLKEDLGRFFIENEDVS